MLPETRKTTTVLVPDPRSDGSVMQSHRASALPSGKWGDGTIISNAEGFHQHLTQASPALALASRGSHRGVQEGGCWTDGRCNDLISEHRFHSVRERDSMTEGACHRTMLSLHCTLSREIRGYHK